MNALALAIGGFISNMAGGLLADKFENKSLMAKSYICILSSLTAFPLTALCCMVRGNFWVSMTAITMKTLLSSTFTSPAMTMM